MDEESSALECHVVGRPTSPRPLQFVDPDTVAIDARGVGIGCVTVLHLERLRRHLLGYRHPPPPSIGPVAGIGWNGIWPMRRSHPRPPGKTDIVVVLLLGADQSSRAGSEHTVPLLRQRHYRLRQEFHHDQPDHQ